MSSLNTSIISHSTFNKTEYILQKCKNYNEYHILTMIGYLRKKYLSDAYCGIRITMDKFNIDVI